MLSTFLYGQSSQMCECACVCACACVVCVGICGGTADDRGVYWRDASRSSAATRVAPLLTFPCAPLPLSLSLPRTHTYTYTHTHAPCLSASLRVPFSPPTPTLAPSPRSSLSPFSSLRFPSLLISALPAYGCVLAGGCARPARV